MASVLSTKYARALLDLLAGSPETELDAVLRELKTFEALYLSSAELRNALSSPAVAIVTREKVIAVLVKRLDLTDLVRRFLSVVSNHGRMPMLSEIISGVDELIDERMGRITADVGVASEVPEALQEAIRARLASVTGKQVRARFKVDEDLIGGFRAQIASTVYDASVKGQFDALRHRLGEVH